LNNEDQVNKMVTGDTFKIFEKNILVLKQDPSIKMAMMIANH